MNSIITVQNISKKYVLSHQSSGRYIALRDVITDKAKIMFQRVRHPLGGHDKNDPHFEDFYALKDVSLEINQGDRVGVIGRNGAGKSTLLKVISRITEPSAGKIILRGRISSLLEVGTGFHPELTGRENIFLNGAILGMRRAEIVKRFDEIVAFAEIEKFLDTPVKKYSSGMYVRLAFAVAAHMQPEILIIDEVLSVGDAIFQKKCMGKMEELSKQKGITILMVSHNMQAIESLCQKAVFLKKGQLTHEGTVKEMISKYIQSEEKYMLTTNTNIRDRLNRSFGDALFSEFYLMNQKNKQSWEFEKGEKILFKISFEILKPITELGVMLRIKSPFSGEPLVNMRQTFHLKNTEANKKHSVVIEVDPGSLLPGNYPLYIWAGRFSDAYPYDVLDENVNLPYLVIKKNSELEDEYTGYNGFIEMKTKILEDTAC